MPRLAYGLDNLIQTLNFSFIQIRPMNSIRCHRWPIVATDHSEEASKEMHSMVGMPRKRSLFKFVPKLWRSDSEVEDSEVDDSELQSELNLVRQRTRRLLFPSYYHELLRGRKWRRRNKLEGNGIRTITVINDLWLKRHKHMLRFERNLKEIWLQLIYFG